MFNLIIFLLGTLNSEAIGTNDYRISRFILSNLNNISSYNISQIAASCYVSVSSVSRFCRKVGFEDFNTLKFQLYQWSSEIENKFHYPEIDERDITNSFFLGIENNLQLLKGSLNTQDLDALVHDILSYKEVAAFGTLHSQSVVLNLQTNLLRSGVILDTRSQFREQLEYINNANADNLIIFFSRQGTQLKRLLESNIQIKSSNKPRIIMITSNTSVPQHKWVDKSIYYAENDGFTAYPFAFEAIASILAIKVSFEKEALKEKDKGI